MRLREVCFNVGVLYRKLFTNQNFLEHKEIELLQQRLDETSGLLSEQKIKSSDLERTLEQCRKEYDDKISVALKEGGRSQEALKKELVVFRQLMESSIGTQLEELKPLFGSQKKEIDTKIDDLQERYPYPCLMKIS